MATRLYFSSDLPPGITFESFSDLDPFNGEVNGQQFEGALINVLDESPLHVTQNFAETASASYVLDGFFVSNVLASQTILETNTIIGQIMCRNYGDDSDVDTTYCEIFIVPPSVGSYEVVLQQEMQAPSEFPPDGTVSAWGRNHQIFDGNVDHEIDVIGGSRIVVAIYYLENSSGAEPSIFGFSPGTDPLNHYASDLTEVDETDTGAQGFGARGWIEFSEDLTFIENEVDFGTNTVACSSTVSGALRTKPSPFYNIYKSIDPMGPWELVNEEPIRDSQFGNEYDVTELVNGVLYYIMVVGGRLNEITGEFEASCGQPLKPGQDVGSETLNPNLVAARPKRISNIATASLGLQVTLTSTGTL